MKRSTNNASGSNSMLTLISVVIIVAFVIASALLVIPHVQQRMTDKAMRNGEQEPNVAFLAKEQNMSVEDFLAQYGLTVGDAVNADTLASEMVQNMTIGNYNKYVGEQGGTIDVSQFSDAVTEDTLYKDFVSMPAKKALGDEAFATAKQTYGLADDAVTDETSLQDFEKAVADAANAKQQAASAEGQNAQTTGAAQETPAK
ncbi:MAG: hypothetical protein IJH17_02745 [Clostridia bacterium]|nr:hypothetical protein [Clostridia bacterium]